MGKQGWVLASSLVLVFACNVASAQKEHGKTADVAAVTAPANGSPSAKTSGRGQATLDSIKVVRSGQAINVQIDMDRPSKPTVSTLTDPDRLVLDFLDTISTSPKNHIEVNRDGVTAVRIGEHANPPMTRVAVVLTEPRAYEIAVGEHGVTLKLKTPAKREHGIPSPASAQGSRATVATGDAPRDSDPPAGAASNDAPPPSPAAHATANDAAFPANNAPAANAAAESNAGAPANASTPPANNAPAANAAAESNVAAPANASTPPANSVPAANAAADSNVAESSAGDAAPANSNPAIPPPADTAGPAAPNDAAPAPANSAGATAPGNNAAPTAVNDAAPAAAKNAAASAANDAAAVAANHSDSAAAPKAGTENSNPSSAPKVDPATPKDASAAADNPGEDNANTAAAAARPDATAEKAGTATTKAAPATAEAALRPTSPDPGSAAEAPGERNVASASPVKTAPATNVKPAATLARELPDGGEYVIGEQDQLTVTVWREPEMSGPVVVRPDGKITLPLINEVKVAGLTPAQAQNLIAEKLKPFVNVPQVTVIVRQVNSHNVYVIGQVSKRGMFPINNSTTVLQLIAEAGGLTDYAKRKSIYILRNEKGSQVRYNFNYDDVIRGKKSAQNILLRPGDTLVIP